MCVDVGFFFFFFFFFSAGREGLRYGGDGVERTGWVGMSMRVSAFGNRGGYVLDDLLRICSVDFLGLGVGMCGMAHGDLFSCAD